MNTHRRILPEVIEVCGKPPKPFWKGPVLVYRTATPNTFQTTSEILFLYARRKARCGERGGS